MNLWAWCVAYHRGRSQEKWPVERVGTRRKLTQRSSAGAGHRAGRRSCSEAAQHRNKGGSHGGLRLSPRAKAPYQAQCTPCMHVHHLNPSKANNILVLMQMHYCRMPVLKQDIISTALSRTPPARMRLNAACEKRSAMAEEMCPSILCTTRICRAFRYTKVRIQARFVLDERVDDGCSGEQGVGARFESGQVGCPARGHR